MKIIKLGKCAALFLLLSAAGCSGPSAVSRLSEDTARFKVTCLTDDAVPNASYVGPDYGEESRITPEAIAQDAYCASQFKLEKFKNGFVVVLGDSAITEANVGSHYTWVNELNNELYAQVMAFAQRWSSKHGQADGYPILTGSGTGLMQAAARGAMSGAGVSIGYGIYFGREPVVGSLSERPFTRNPAFVFARYSVKGVDQPIISDGLIFSSATVRDDAMLRQAAAIVVAPGGFGTQGLLFRILEMRKNRQLANVPIYIVGDRKFYWSGWNELQDKMILAGTVTQKDIDGLKVEFVEKPVHVVERLEARLGLK